MFHRMRDFLQYEEREHHFLQCEAKDIEHRLTASDTWSLCSGSQWVDKLYSRHPIQCLSNGQACFPFDACVSVLELELSASWILLLFNGVGVCVGGGFK